MADERNVRITPPQPEVEGHGIGSRHATPEADQEPDVEGHLAKYGATPETDREADVEVAGHIAATTDAEGIPVELDIDDEAFEAPGELDVEGHWKVH